MKTTTAVAAVSCSASVLLLLLSLSEVQRSTEAFLPPLASGPGRTTTHQHQHQHQRQQQQLLYMSANDGGSSSPYNNFNDEHEREGSSNSNNNADDGDDDTTNQEGGGSGEQQDFLEVNDQDWRAFRARLVMSEPRAGEDEEEDDDDERPIPAGAILAQEAASMQQQLQQQMQAEEEDGDEEFCEPVSGDCDLDGFGAVFGIRSKPTLQQQQENIRRELENTSQRNNDLPLSSRPHPREKPQLSAEQLLQQMTPLDPSQWAYDSGKLIEKGAVMLGGVDQEFGFGLRQQYFHKAAILVLDHDETTFTKGIILNRPTDLYLADDLNEGVKWRVWYGGDVQGLMSDSPDVVCLHSLSKNKAVSDASVPIMDDLQWTTFDNAKRLVHAGYAESEDFWVFCGYAGWGPQQLAGELDRKSWYMVATDSQTLLKEMQHLSPAAGQCDPRDAGLETWTLLMQMIGRGDTAEDVAGSFDDLMLKEWALKNLLSSETGGGAGEQESSLPEDPPPSATISASMTSDLWTKSPVDRMLSRAEAASHGKDAKAGTLIRAAPTDRSPFLLEDQEFIRSVILVLADDDAISVGAILNRPATKALDVQVSHDGESQQSNLPIRFGGQYSVKGGEPLLWMHCSSMLREAGIGSPLADVGNDGIWKCTADDVTEAVGQGLALPEDFLVVTGVTVWPKNPDNTEQDESGIAGEIRKGRFEIVPEGRVDAVWDVLKQQQVLTNANLLKNCRVADEAWVAAGESPQTLIGPPGRVPDTLGDSNEGDRVFKSDVKVSQLSEKALRSWVATFLLGAPTLGA